MKCSILPENLHINHHLDKVETESADRHDTEVKIKNSSNQININISIFQELKLLMWLALPIVFNAIIGQTGLISLYYVGRLNEAKLIGGVTLGNMMCNLTGYSLMIGMCSALDTLLSQAYGSKSYYLLGQYSYCTPYHLTKQLT